MKMPEEPTGELKPNVQDWLLAPNPRVEGGVELPDRKRMRLLTRDLNLADEE